MALEPFVVSVASDLVALKLELIEELVEVCLANLYEADFEELKMASKLLFAVEEIDFVD